MEKRNMRLFQRITSPLWKWGTIALAVIFIVCNVFLLASVDSDQGEVKESVAMIDHLNELRKSVRSLSRSLIDQPSRADDPWIDLVNDYEITLSGINYKKAEAIGFL